MSAILSGHNAPGLMDAGNPPVTQSPGMRRVSARQIASIDATVSSIASPRSPPVSAPAFVRQRDSNLHQSVQSGLQAAVSFPHCSMSLRGGRSRKRAGSFILVTARYCPPITPYAS